MGAGAAGGGGAVVVPPPPEPTGALPPVRRTRNERVAERRVPLVATAVTVRVWVPVFSVEVASLPLSPFMTKGVRRSVQRSLPSTRNSTRLIAGLAETFALTLMLPDTSAPAFGVRNVTVGPRLGGGRLGARHDGARLAGARGSDDGHGHDRREGDEASDGDAHGGG